MSKSYRLFNIQQLLFPELVAKVTVVAQVSHKTA